MWFRSLPGLLASAAFLLAAAGGTYETSIGEWRKEREAKLRAEDGWLSLAGLFWLEQGSNPVGSQAGSRVELPAGFPSNAATLIRNGRTVRLRTASPDVQVNGKAPSGAVVLKSDLAAHPDIISIGRLKLLIIERGTKIGVRLKDPQSKARTGFVGLSWYPVRPEWKVRGRFVAESKKLLLDASAGDKQSFDSPGYVEWEMNGQKLTLRPVMEDGAWFYVFRDATAGKTTYAAARFLYSDPPSKDGAVVLDFNKAYNPPCVFTPYATCPLPPPANRLKIAVEAGEKMYAGH